LKKIKQKEKTKEIIKIMKTIIKYIALSLFLILLSNCSEDKIELSGRGTITGKVVSVGDKYKQRKMVFYLHLNLQM